MKGTFRRWYQNINWLLNHPPTSITVGDGMKCSYCENKAYWEFPWANFAFCQGCMKKVFDKVLLDGK